MLHRITILALSLPLIATGCATGTKAPYPDQPDQSFALNQMRAAGFEAIHDADISKAQAKQLDDTEASPLAAGAFGAANALTPPAGLSSFSAGALGFMSWMAMGERNPAQTSRVIAWVPASEADSPAEARELVVEELTSALETVTADFDLQEGYRFAGMEKEVDNTWDRYRWPIKGNDCGPEAWTCQYQVSFNRWGYAQGLWTKTKAPESLGGMPAYRMSEPQYMPAFSPSKFNESEWTAGFPDLSLYAELSDELPDWIMLYLAPRHVSYLSGGTQYEWEFLGLPILLRDGEAHYFIEPD